VRPKTCHLKGHGLTYSTGKTDEYKSDEHDIPNKSRTHPSILLGRNIMKYSQQTSTDRIYKSKKTHSSSG